MIKNKEGLDQSLKIHKQFQVIHLYIIYKNRQFRSIGIFMSSLGTLIKVNCWYLNILNM
jgi:hypothetical protein